MTYARSIVHVQLLVLLAGLFPVPAVAAEVIRVVVADNLRSVTISSQGRVYADGVAGASQQNKLTVFASSVGKQPVRFRPHGAFLSVNGKQYRGVIELRKKKGASLLVINEVDLEEYLLGVVAAEIPADWEMEALKAQAVASRTYAVYQMQNAGRRTYHILATVDSQMYLGKRGERPRATQAVEATRGMVITYRGEVVPAFYHASCGGHTEDALVLWGIDEPYLKGVDCDCQNISKYGLWEKRVTTTDIIRALRREGYRLGEIGSVEIGSLTAAGRVTSVLFRHAGGTTSVPAETIRATLGYSSLPSIFFEPELIDREVVLSGRGLGHGVGLCQWGAKEMARRGADFQAILAYYYPGTVLVRSGGD